MENNKAKQYKNLKKEELFFCYSLPLQRYLKINNFWYLYREVNPKTDKCFFVFERTPEFTDALTYFTNEKRKALGTSN